MTEEAKEQKDISTGEAEETAASETEAKDAQDKEPQVAEEAEKGEAKESDAVEGEISVEKEEDVKESGWKDFVRKHQIYFIIGSIVLFLGIVALVAVFFFRDKGEVDFSGGVKANQWMGAVVSFSINAMLAEDPDGIIKNLDVELFLELDNNEAIEEVVDKKNKLNDIFIGLIAEKKAKDVDSLAEQKRLKKRIKELANAYIYSGRVEKIYFTRFRIVANDYMQQIKKD